LKIPYSYQLLLLNIKRWIRRITMSKEQQYVFVELRATFNLPVEDAEKLSYEELEELALDYFINDDGCNSANYEYEFDY